MTTKSTARTSPMRFVIVAASLVFNFCCCHAFVEASVALQDFSHTFSTWWCGLPVPWNAPPPEALTPEMTHNRGEFYFWFFGSSGAAGIGRRAFPRFFAQLAYQRSLKGCQPTLGGETLGISPLCGFPQDACTKDINQVLNNPMSIQDMVTKCPIQGNFLSEKGHIAFDAFAEANPKANPLALRVIFDTFAQSNDFCNPVIAQEKLDGFRADVTQIPNALLKAKLTGSSAVLVLLFLLGGADIVAAHHGQKGWFPEWPGAVDFPIGMFTQDHGAPWNTKDYWI